MSFQKQVVLKPKKGRTEILKRNLAQIKQSNNVKMFRELEWGHSSDVNVSEVTEV